MVWKPLLILLVEVGLKAQNAIWNFRAPRGIIFNNFKARVNQHPCWYLDLFEWGLSVAILRPKNVKSELRHPDLV